MLDKQWLASHEWFQMQYVPSCVLWFLDGFMKSFAIDAERDIGAGVKNLFYIHKDGDLHMYFAYDEYKVAGELLLQQTLGDPTVLENILSGIKNGCRELFFYSHELQTFDPTTLTGEQLLNHYRRFLSIHDPLWVKGQFVNLLEHGHSLLQPKVQEMLVADGIAATDVTGVLSTLTSGETYGYNQKEEQAIIRLALNEHRTDEDIQAHYRLYSCTGYGWSGPGWDKAYFQERIDLLTKDKMIRSKLKSEADYGREIQLKKQGVLRHYALKEKTLRFVRLLERIVSLKELRVDASLLGYWSIEPLLSEIARRHRLTLRQVQYVLPEEMVSLLLAGEADVNRLNQRYHLNMFYWRDGVRYEIAGTSAVEHLEYFEKTVLGDVEDVSELKGDCGSPGTARGVVTIINKPEDLHKMKDGHVLVSHATDPRFVPAMKKAVAIVAEVGGITCHAAIVARELGIPCVIGVKNATRILHDGDSVEIDAVRGIIRKIL